MLRPDAQTYDICVGDESFDSQVDLYNACAGAWVETSETSTLIWQEAISELEDVATYGQPTFALKKSEGL